MSFLLGILATLGVLFLVVVGVIVACFANPTAVWGR